MEIHDSYIRYMIDCTLTEEDARKIGLDTRPLPPRYERCSSALSTAQ